MEFEKRKRKPNGIIYILNTGTLLFSSRNSWDLESVPIFQIPFLLAIHRASLARTYHPGHFN